MTPTFAGMFHKADNWELVHESLLWHENHKKGGWIFSRGDAHSVSLSPFCVHVRLRDTTGGRGHMTFELCEGILKCKMAEEISQDAKTSDMQTHKTPQQLYIYKYIRLYKTAYRNVSSTFISFNKMCMRIQYKYRYTFNILRTQQHLIYNPQPLHKQ